MARKTSDSWAAKTVAVQPNQDVLERLTSLETTQSWHGKIGWTISGILAIAFCSVLGWLLTSHIPSQIRAAVPEDLSSKLGSLQQHVEDMQKQLDRQEHLLERIVPTSLEKLIPPPKSQQSSKAQVADLTAANNIIDNAIFLNLPSSPKLLKPLLERTQLLRATSAYEPVRKVSTGTLVRLSAYSTPTIGEGLMNAAPAHPRTLSKAEAGKELGPTTVATLNLNCKLTDPSQALGATNRAAAENSIFIDLKIEHCAQPLGYFNWINVVFENSIVKYSGGPLRLANVQFRNCTFDFTDDEVGRDLLRRIKQYNGQGLSFYAGTANTEETERNIGKILVFPPKNSPF